MHQFKEFKECNKNNMQPVRYRKIWTELLSSNVIDKILIYCLKNHILPLLQIFN